MPAFNVGAAPVPEIARGAVMFQRNKNQGLG